MGGIAGRYNFRSRAPVAAHVIHGMCDLLSHRGPDGHGVFVDGAVGLGHRRLAILDPSEAGRQPMCSPDGNLSVVFDGEIYNFLELRADLAKRGHHFRSGTDTEVLLAAYRQWGIGSIERLRGMFSFAIWDRSAQTLLIARDRLGKKPLHYWLDKHGVAFASEPKAFLAESGFDPSPDVEAISHYLSYQHVPSPASAFENVRKLPPAHYMLVAAGRLRTERYWELRYNPKRQSTEREACEEILARLTGAVRLRLVSDVPLGAFLDGRIDSSAIVALAAAQRGPLKTFSISMEEEEDEEGASARAIVDHYSTDHHHAVVRPDARDIIPKLVWHYGEPFADRSAIATYYLSELARRHVTVVLNGNASDEVFGDCARHGATGGLGRAFERLPAKARRLVHSLVCLLSSADRPVGWLSRGKRWTGRLAMSAEERYAFGMMQFPPWLKASLCTPEFVVAATRDSREMLLDEFRRTDATDGIDMLLHADVKRYLPDALLVKVDIASMAHGLESRCPLLDHELMEFVATLPVDFKRRGASTKCILKRVVRPLLPLPSERPRKNVSVPLARWFRHDLKEMAYGLLLDRRTIERGYFHAYVVKRMLDEHVRKVHDWADQLWSLLMLELWHRAFTDARPVAASRPHPIADALEGMKP